MASRITKKKRRKKRDRPPLDERHLLAVELLTTVPTLDRGVIARKIGINRRTLYRWENRADFEALRIKTIHRKLGAMKPIRRPLTNIADIEWVLRINKLI